MDNGTSYRIQAVRLFARALFYTLRTVPSQKFEISSKVLHMVYFDCSHPSTNTLTLNRTAITNKDNGKVTVCIFTRLPLSDNQV